MRRGKRTCKNRTLFCGFFGFEYDCDHRLRPLHVRALRAVVERVHGGLLFGLAYADGRVWQREEDMYDANRTRMEGGEGGKDMYSANFAAKLPAIGRG